MIERILMPLDGSPLAEQALAQAAAVARAFDAELLLLRVQETPPGAANGCVDAVSWRLNQAEIKAYLSRLAAGLGARGVRAATLLAEGSAAEQILEAARTRRADVIVLGAHGHGGRSRFHLGGTARKVVSRAVASVLIVRNAEPAAEVPAEVRYQRVMVPLDGSQRAQWALHLASSIARAHQGEILLVHVVEVPQLPGRMPPAPEERELTQKLAELDRKTAEGYLAEMEALLSGSGLAVKKLLVESPHVVQALEKVAADERVSLMVVSAHGRSGAAPWPYGSVADRLIEHGTTPLLVFQDLPAREPEEAQGTEPELRLATAR